MKKTVIAVGAGMAVVFGLAFAWKPPQNSSDVAGWAQAFGSMAAIGLAVWLQYEAKTEKERQAHNLAVAFAGQVLLGFDALHLACKNKHTQDYNSARTTLENALKLELHEAELNVNMLALVMTLRGMIASVIGNPPNVLGMLDFMHQALVAGNLSDDARKIMAKAGLNPPAKAHSP
jgi:hypothetical protein